MDSVNLLKEIFSLSLYAVRSKKNSKTLGKYDPGKYGIHIELIEKEIYGIYYQTYDSPEGDTWESWVVQIRVNELKILSHKVDSNRFYSSYFFKKELDKVPYGEIKK